MSQTFRAVTVARVASTAPQAIPASSPRTNERWPTITPEFPDVTPHDLRHSAASLAINVGANVKAVQTMLGHKSAALTLDTYADLFPDDLEAVATALDAAATAVRKATADALRTKIEGDSIQFLG
jgi:hypothetical protein